MAQCYGQVFECQCCVCRWLESHATYPHCSSVVEDTFPLKGFNDVFKCLQCTIDERPFSLAGYVSLSDTSSD